MIDREDLIINESTYQRCVRGFSFLQKRLNLDITLHDPAGAVESGQIFLFNHFARFETIVPQYLIYQETGAYCRTLASQEFFAGNGGFAKFLLDCGFDFAGHQLVLSLGRKLRIRYLDGNHGRQTFPRIIPSGLNLSFFS